MKIKLGSKEVFIIVSLLSIIFFTSVFGIVGLRVLLGAFFVYFLPFYLILGRADIEESERLIFAFFIGLGVVSTITFYLGYLFGLRTSYALSIVIIYALALGLRYKDLGRLKKSIKKISESVDIEE